MSAAQDILEEVVDVVEETMDVVEGAAKTVEIVTRNNPWVIAGVAAVSAAIGAGVAYKVTKSRMTVQFDQMMNEEIEATREQYALVYKDEYETPGDLVRARIHLTPGSDDVPVSRETVEEHVEAADTVVSEEELRNIAQVMATYQGRPVDDETPTYVVSEDGFDYEAEMRNRTTDKPYVISKEEFLEAEPGYPQSVITYYLGDDMLIDDTDEPFQDGDAVVGDTNIMRMGEGSGDPNVVYVRNDKLSIDFEVVKHPGKYHEIVLGLGEIKHSYEPRKIRKFRNHDE